MDPTNYYQQLMAQALMGPLAQPGMMPSGQMPMTQAGQRSMTGSPTVPGGMLGSSPWTPFDPNAPQGPIPPSMGALSQQTDMNQQGNPQQNNPFQLQQPFQAYPFPEPRGGGGGAESGGR